MANNLDKIYNGFPVLNPSTLIGTFDNIYNGFPILISAIDESNPPSKAILSGPMNTGTDISILTHLVWANGDNAVQYKIYFGIADPPVTLVNTVSQENWIPPIDLEYETEYFWKINSINAAGETPGDIWSFTTAALTVPNKVTNSSPQHNAIGINVNINPSWTDGGGAPWYTHTYDVYFETNNPPSFIGNQSDLSYEPGVLEYETDYYWRINPKNYDGTTTGDIFKFTTATNTPPGKATTPNPIDDETGIILVVPALELSWIAGSNTDSFDIYLEATNPPTIKVASQIESTFSPSGILHDTEYFWRINSINFDGETTGDVWSFITSPIEIIKETNLNDFCNGNPLLSNMIGTTDPLDEWINGAPVKPFLNLNIGQTPIKVGAPNPENNATLVDIFKVLTWIDQLDYLNYNIYFGITDTPGFIKNQIAKNYDPGELEYNTQYWWYINPIQGGQTTTGDLWTFTTRPVTPPEKMILPSPSNNMVDVATNKIILWQNGGGAMNYDVYFGTNNPPTFIGNQVETNYNPGILDNNTEYFWRIDTVNVDGTTTGDVMSFTTRSEIFFENPQRRTIIVITS